MTAHTHIADKDFTDTLDHILDKGIVIDQLVRIITSGTTLELPNVERIRIEKISIQASGQRPIEIEELESLFPFWRRDLWSK